MVTHHSEMGASTALTVELPASKYPDRIPPDVPVADPRFYPMMDGPAIFKKQWDMRLLPMVIKDSLKKAQMTMEQGRVGKSGDVVLFAALGAGLTWGSTIYKFL